MNKTIKIILIIVLVIASISIVAIFSTKAPKESAQIFTQELLSKDFKNAYDRTSPKFKESYSFEEFNKISETIEDFDSNSKISFNQREINGGLAQISGNIKNRKGEKIYIAFYLIKEDSVWKIIGYKFSELPIDILE